MLWGGRNTADKPHRRVRGVRAVTGPRWVCPAHCMCAFPVSAQAPGCSAGNCLRRALGCVHFPGLCRSGSGSQAQTQLGLCSVPAFCALPGPSSPGDQVLGEPHSPDAVHLSTSPVPAAWLPGCAAASQVCRVSLLGS